MTSWEKNCTVQSPRQFFVILKSKYQYISRWPGSSLRTADYKRRPEMRLLFAGYPGSETRIPSSFHFLISGYLRRTPENSPFFRVP